MAYGLLFDVDGVLADTEALIATATIDMYKEFYGLDLTPEDFRAYIGTGAVRYTEGPAEVHGIEIDLERAIQKRHDNFVALLESGDGIACPGAETLVEAAGASPDWAMAMATSSPTEKSKDTLKAARLNTDLFDAWITGDMVTHKKPHPEIYLKAADAVGLRPAQCVVVEDALTGVASAKAAGMPCVAVTNSFRAEELAAADLIVDSLEALDLARLAQLLG
jgi:HAD superfamily hydrolase (TIGR01509 family)